MKKINIIGTVGVPACYGGFESLVENMLDYTPEDVEYTVFCTSQKYETKLESYKGAKLVYLDLDANGMDSIMYDYKSMKMSLDADIMLVLGVSGCMFLPFIRRKFKGKIITNIDGLEWKRDKWNPLAKWLLHYSEKQAVKYSDVVIGDNKGITDYVKETYKKDAVLIAYGGDHVTKVQDDSLYEKYPYMKHPYAVTVCRIEPENNVHKIIEAFSRIPEKQLVIVGNWKNSEYGTNLKEQFSKFENIHLLDPIYESHEINWIRSNASLYVHGHSAGGTNPSLVEAMNFGLPILAFDCVYNRATTQDECLYWSTEEDIIDLVNNSESKFDAIANKMKELGAKEYAWEKIARKYNDLYY
jgi:glycosyltransferase involved in cell wall biosynthesis